MATIMFVIVFSGAGVFLISCLFHFGGELKLESRRKADVDLWIASQKFNIVPLHFAGPGSIAMWSEGTRNRLLSKMDRPELPDMKGEGRKEAHFDAAA